MGNYNQSTLNENNYNNLEYENVNSIPTAEGYYCFKWNNYDVKAYYDGVNSINGNIYNSENKLLFSGVIKHMVPFSGTAYKMFYNGYTFDGTFDEYKFTGHLEYNDTYNKWEEGTFDEKYNLLNGIRYDNGTLYSGQFIDGQLDGDTGRKVFADNSEQYGKFVKGHFVDGVYVSGYYKYDGHWLLDTFVKGSIYKNGILLYEGVCCSNFEPYNGQAYDYEYYYVLDDTSYMFTGQFENGYFNGQVLYTSEDNNYIQNGEFVKTSGKFRLVNGTSIDTLHNIVYQGRWLYVDDHETFDGKVYKYIKENKTIDGKDNDYIYSGQIVDSKYFTGDCDGLVIAGKKYYGLCKDYMFTGAVYNENNFYKVYYGTLYFNDTSGTFNMVDGLAFKYVNGQYTYSGRVTDYTFSGVVRHNDLIMNGEFYEKSNVLRKGTITYPDGTIIDGEWNKDSYLHGDKIVITDEKNNQSIYKYNNGEKQEYRTFEISEPIDEDKELVLEFNESENKSFDFTGPLEEKTEFENKTYYYEGTFDTDGFVEGVVKAVTLKDLQDNEYYKQFKYIIYSYTDDKPFQGYYNRTELRQGQGQTNNLILKQVVLPNEYIINCTCSLYVLNSLHRLYKKNHLLDYSNISSIIISALSVVELLMLFTNVIPNISTECISSIIDNNFDGLMLSHRLMYSITLTNMGFTRLQLLKLDSLEIWKYV
jgi:hypothetical protein